MATTDAYDKVAAREAVQEIFNIVKQSGHPGNYLYDSGRRPINSFESNFECYDTQLTPVLYRRIGNVVYLSGACRALNTLSPYEEGSTTSVAEYDMFTLPEGYRPKYDAVFLCQGSGSGKWCMVVHTDGRVTCSRYSATTRTYEGMLLSSGYVDIVPNTWMPFSVSYDVDHDSSSETSPLTNTVNGRSGTVLLTGRDIPIEQGSTKSIADVSAASIDSVSDLDAIITGRTKSVFSEEVESASSSYVYGKVNYSANAGEKITVNISGTAFTGTKTTMYFFYGDSTTHTSVGLVDLNTDLEFVLPDSITAIDTYRANEAQPGTVIFTVTKVSSSGGIVGNVQKLNTEVSGIQDTLGDNTLHVEKDHASGTLNLEVLFSANAGEKISVKPYGTAFVASFCNVYARYVGESSNTNLGRAYIGQDNIFELTGDTEKFYVYTMNTQSGTASVDIRKLGLKDNVADLLAAVNPIKGKKLNFLGDSITYGGGAATRFTDVLASMLDCTCRNYGIIGSTITYDENRNPMCIRYADMDDDADIVAVMGGTNDYWNNKPLGQMGDTANTTFYGALDIMIRGLIAKYPAALFYMVTPPHGDNGDNFDGSEKSQSGSMQDIANAVKEVAAKYSVPVLDVFNSGGLYPSIQAQNSLYYSDGVHLNTEGQRKLANLHAAFLTANFRD